MGLIVPLWNLDLLTSSYILENWLFSEDAQEFCSILWLIENWKTMKIYWMD